MYLIEIKKLREDLRADKSEGRYSWPYFVAFFVLFQLGVLFSNKLKVSENADASKWVESLFEFVVAVGGIVYAYQENGGPSGRQFINRFFPIAWVMAWRVALIAIPVMIAAYFSVYFMTLPGEKAQVVLHVLQFASGPVISMVVYWLVGRELQSLSEGA